jgi:ApeA N-terminal domain 1/Apea-like HEPN
MKVTKPLDAQGFWWMPGTPEIKVPGRLLVSADGAVSLELLGHVQQSPLPHGPIEFLHGVLHNGKLVTLLDSQYSHSSLNMPGIATARLNALWAFVGTHFSSPTDLCFSKTYFHVEGLDRWLGLTGIRVTFDAEYRSATINYQPIPPIAFPLEDGSTLRILFSWTLPSIGGSVESASVSQKANLCFETPSPVPFAELSSTIYRLNCLLCLAINETVSLTELEFSSPTLIDASSHRELLVEVYGRTMPQSESSPKFRPFGQLFIYHQVRDRFGSLVSGWLQNFQTIEPALNLYFAVATSDSMFLENQFLFLVQGLETLHRRTLQETMLPLVEFDSLTRLLIEACPTTRREWLSARLGYANELPLRRRLGDLLGGLSRVLWLAGDNDFPISDVVDTRNYLTHFDPGLEERASRGRDLFTLTEMLQAAFALLLLGRIGFASDEIKRVAENCQGLMRKLRRQI